MPRVTQARHRNRYNPYARRSRVVRKPLRRRAKRSFGGRRRYKRYSRSGPNINSFTALTKRLNTGQNTVRSTPFAIKMLKAVGDFHVITNNFVGVSSTTVNNPLSIFFHASLNASVMGSQGNWSTKDTNTWGNNVYGQEYVDNEKYLLESSRFKLIFTQVGENCRFRVCVVNPKSNVKADATYLSGWNHDIDQMQNIHNWNVLKTTYLKFDDPSDTTLVNHRVKTMEFTLPYNKMFRTHTGTTASGTSSWDNVGYNQNWFLVIDNDDATSADSQFVSVEIFVMHKFYKVIA